MVMSTEKSIEVSTRALCAQCAAVRAGQRSAESLAAYIRAQLTSPVVVFTNDTDLESKIDVSKRNMIAYFTYFTGVAVENYRKVRVDVVCGVVRILANIRLHRICAMSVHSMSVSTLMPRNNQRTTSTTTTIIVFCSET